MTAARRYALRRGAQHLDDSRLVIAPLPARAAEADRLARQRTAHEDGLAREVGHAATFLIQRLDLRGFDRGRSRHARTQAASYSRQCDSARSASQLPARSSSAA